MMTRKSHEPNNRGVFRMRHSYYYIVLSFILITNIFPIIPVFGHQSGDDPDDAGSGSDAGGSIYTALEVTPGHYSGEATTDTINSDEDWYKINTTVEDFVFLTITITLGSLDVQVWENSQTLLIEFVDKKFADDQTKRFNFESKKDGFITMMTDLADLPNYFVHLNSSLLNNQGDRGFRG